MSLIPGGLNSTAQTGNSQAPAQAAQRDYRFEVASIRRGDPTCLLSGPPGPSYTPGRFRSDSNTIPGLAFQAFRKNHAFELQSPQWMWWAHFTVNATLPEGATKADLPVMIQHLLEDRFELKYHHETRQMAGYELVVAKSGSKLAKSVGPVPDPSTIKGPGFDFKNGAPQFSKDAGNVDMCFGAGCALHGRNRTLQALAANLADKLHVPVMDATGLEGRYDYTLFFTGEIHSGPGIMASPLPSGGPPGPAAGGDGAPLPLAYPLLHDALVEQLGLKLQPVKNVPVDVVVLDSAKKEPTEN